MGIYLFAILGIVLVLILGFGISLSEPGYKGPVSDHFDGKQFYNPKGGNGNGLREVLKHVVTLKRGEWKENYENYSHSDFIEDYSGEGIKVFFVNHSTFLIQMDGLNILTDPVWSKRVSPLSWAGSKRYRKPGVSLDLLPKIDLVLLSHNHYDHLDIATIKILEKVHSPKFIVPLGVDKILLKNGISDIQQLDWHSHTVFKGLKIIAAPAIHTSARGMFDKNKTLWCGFILKGSKNLYYAGDTAYDNELFKKIGKKYSGVDVSLIPIGAYKPEWFMSSIHTNPEEAVKIHLDIGSKKSMACHFGTFELSEEGQPEVSMDLGKALNKLQVPKKDFIMPDEGVFYTF